MDNPSVLIAILTILVVPFWGTVLIFKAYPPAMHWALGFVKSVMGCDGVQRPSIPAQIAFIIVTLLYMPSAILARLLRMTPNPGSDFCMGVGIKPCRMCPRYRRGKDGDNDAQNAKPESGDGNA